MKEQTTETHELVSRDNLMDRIRTKLKNLEATETHAHELVTRDNLMDIISTKLKNLVGCSCGGEDWHYMRLCPGESDNYYTDLIEFGRQISPSYPAKIGGHGIDPRYVTVSLPCCDCHDIGSCDCEEEEECPCADCDCLCHHELERAEELVDEIFQMFEEHQQSKVVQV